MPAQGQVGFEAAALWCSRGRDPDREGTPTCGCVISVVTTCARLEPALLDAVGTQHGPAPLRSELRVPYPTPGGNMDIPLMVPQSRHSRYHLPW
jgi:hypothetical protein